jgi:hypothetical protein
MNTFNSFEELEIELKQIYLKKENAKEWRKSSGLEIQSEINSFDRLKKGLYGAIKCGMVLLLCKTFKKERTLIPKKPTTPWAFYKWQTISSIDRRIQ